MSRCVLDNEKRGTQVVIGWDPPLQTFFARVWIRSLYDFEVANDIEDAGVRSWTGCGNRTWSTAEDLHELIGLVEPYACSHDRDELRQELLLDQASDDGERTYDLYDGSDGWPGDELPANWRPKPIEPPIRWQPD